MNWLSFFIGVLVGWIVEWLIDLFYWRRKYQTCQKEKEALQARLNEAERRIKTFQVKGQDLEAPEADLPDVGIDAFFDGLKARFPDVDLDGSIDRLKARFPDLDLKTALHGLKVDFPDLDIDGAFDSLKARFPHLGVSATLGGVAAEIGERHAELPTIAPQQPDDLKLLEGIGPKISRLLKDNGILTFAQLAAASPDHLWAILQEAGPHFQLANPESWPEQARLAANEAWDELQALQDRLIGGRKTRRWDR